MDDERRKCSLIKLLTKQFLESPNKNEFVSEVLPEDSDKEHLDIFQDVNDFCGRNWQSLMQFS